MVADLQQLKYHAPVIINIDVDVAYLENDDDSERSKRAVDDSTMYEIGKWARGMLDTGSALVATVALSPEESCGWPEAERLAQLVASGMGLKFKLT